MLLSYRLLRYNSKTKVQETLRLYTHDRLAWSLTIETRLQQPCRRGMCVCVIWWSIPGCEMSCHILFIRKNSFDSLFCFFHRQQATQLVEHDRLYAESYVEPVLRRVELWLHAPCVVSRTDNGVGVRYQKFRALWSTNHEFPWNHFRVSQICSFPSFYPTNSTRISKLWLSGIWTADTKWG